jgi:hypothetical protein
MTYGMVKTANIGQSAGKDFDHRYDKIIEISLNDYTGVGGI